MVGDRLGNTNYSTANLPGEKKEQRQAIGKLPRRGYRFVENHIENNFCAVGAILVRHATMHCACLLGVAPTVQKYFFLIFYKRFAPTEQFTIALIPAPRPYPQWSYQDNAVSLIF